MTTYYIDSNTDTQFKTAMYQDVSSELLVDIVGRTD